MGVRKILTRVGNLIYIAGAALAVYGLATKPLLSLSVDVAIPASLVTDLIKEQIPSDDSGNSGQVYTTRSMTREGGSVDTSGMDIGKMLSKVNLEGVFEDLSLKVELTMPSLIEFVQTPAEEQPALIGTVASKAIEDTLDSAYEVLGKGFDKLVPEIAKVAASSVLEDAIGSQIASIIGASTGDPEVDAKLAEVTEEINELVDNVWNTLTSTKAADVAKTFPTYPEAAVAAQKALAGEEGYESWANGDIITVKASDETPEEQIEYYTFNNPTKLVEVEGPQTENHTVSTAKEAYDADKSTWSEGDIVKINTDPVKYMRYETLTLRKTGLATSVDDVMATVQDSINDVFSTLSQTDPDNFPEGTTFDQESLDGIKEDMTKMLSEVGLADSETGEIKDVNEALSLMLQMFMGGGETALDTPANFVFNGNVLSWDAVENAGSYKVTIGQNTPENVTTNSIEKNWADPQYLGQYEVSVVALPEGDDYKESEAGVVRIDNETVPGTPTIVQDQPEVPEGNVRKAVTRDGGSSSTPSTEEMIKQFVEPLLKDLPLDDIKNLNLDQMTGIANMTLYGYAGLILLAALPWLLFALFTLVRTLRPKKCWAKPWFIFVFCFLELILGAGITLGLKYGLPLAAPAISGLMTGEAAKYAALLEGITISFEMSCLLASYVYLAMIPFTIIYAIFAHGPKKEFKIWKKSKKYAKKISKGKMTISEVPEKYQDVTQEIIAKKAKKAAKTA